MAIQTEREHKAWVAKSRRCDVCGKIFQDGEAIQTGLDRNYCVDCDIPQIDMPIRRIRDRFWPRRLCGVFMKPWEPDFKCPVS